MRSDPTTLEMLKEVRIQARWSLVQRVTHLALAVAVGYYWGTHEKSDSQKSHERVEQRTAEILREIRSRRKESGKEYTADSSSRVGSLHSK